MKRFPLSALLLPAALALALCARPHLVHASDHDDGETSTKGRNVNLTDLYVFREVDQQNQVDSGTRTFGGAGDANKMMVFIMNTNPRSLPRQQYFFAPSPTRYEFHVKQVSGVANSFANGSDGKEDMVLRFTFGAPDTNSQQAITLTRLFATNGTVDETSATTVSAGLTTAALPGLGNAVTPVNNAVSVGSDALTVFAGLREDPFFFDVTQFFRVRAGALGKGPAVGMRAANAAIDFTKDYNVNSLAVRMPLAFLQRKSDGSTSTATAFDVWETISVQQ